MTTTPTPEQFLTDAGFADEDDQELQHVQEFAGEFVDTGNPLESIAASLRSLVGMVETHRAEEAADDEAERRYLDLDQAYADLEDKHQALYGLLADVEKIVAPSTSKLANSVREAITRWRAPEAGAEPVVEPDGVPAAVQCPACARYFADAELLDGHHCTGPAPDADVEAWRAYALALGAEGDLSQMNRSQIRTLLGIPQVEGA